MWPRDVETASNLPIFLVLLPFLSSAFVPTDSMPDGLSWFAENQPFTPIIETVRGLLLGTPIGNSGAARRRLVRRDLGRRLPLGEAALRPRPGSVGSERRPSDRRRWWLATLRPVAAVTAALDDLLGSPGFLADPYPIFARFRDESPVHWVERLGLLAADPRAPTSTRRSATRAASRAPTA